MTIILFYCGCQIVFAQNLVLNPSFEDYVGCPSEYGTFQDNVLFWSCPTNGSTDHFSSCSEQMGTHRNFAGGQRTFDGNSYADFYAFGPKDYREYIGGEMEMILQKNQKYIISARVRLSEKSAYAVNELGFLFSDKPLKLETTRNIPHRIMMQKGLSSYIGMTHAKYFAEKSDWIEIKGMHIANGTERYLTFGNFKENRKTKMITTGENLRKAAYYYIDMISVEEAGKPFNLDEVYVFEGLNFDVNGFNIEGEVQEQLQPLIGYLKENPSLNIAIYGRTDNVGGKEYNKVLSEKRAKSVGLSPFRIAWKGYGDESPIVANETKKGRQQNRRVEFVISKKKREFYASGIFEDED